MERMLVVVFDNEKKAYEGQSALRRLELEGNLTIYAGAVVTKHADGTASAKQHDDFGPIGTLLGTSLGSLIGLLGGPAGLAIGTVSGMTLGAIYDFGNARVGADFVDDVSRSLSANKVAVIAEIDEEWTTPVDTRMEALGGTVLRRALWEVEDKLLDEDVAAMGADLAQLKKELATGHAERNAKLQKRIVELQAKIDAKQSKAKERLEAFVARRKANLELVKKNAAAAGRALKQFGRSPL